MKVICLKEDGSWNLGSASGFPSWVVWVSLRTHSFSLRGCDRCDSFCLGFWLFVFQ